MEPNEIHWTNQPTVCLVFSSTVSSLVTVAELLHLTGPLVAILEETGCKPVPTPPFSGYSPGFTG